jgi:hypothetical protein
MHLKATFNVGAAPPRPPTRLIIETKTYPEGEIGGTTEPPPGTYEITMPGMRLGPTQRITARPYPNYMVTNWEWWWDDWGPFVPERRDVESIEVTIPEGKTTRVRVTFHRKTYKVRIRVNNPAWGGTRPPPGEYTYSLGQYLEFTAWPMTFERHMIERWEIRKGGKEVKVETLPWMTNVDNDIDIMVYFAERPPPKIPTVKVTVRNANPELGTVYPEPRVHEYPAGVAVNFSATPKRFCEFDYWEVDGKMYKQPAITINVDRDMTITAHFKTTKVTLTIKVLQPDLGTTEPPPGTYSYDVMSKVTIVARPKPGASFEYWQYDGRRTFEPSLTLTLDGSYTVYASFAPVRPALKYTLKVFAMPGGTTRPAPGSYTYDTGARVMVEATPYSGYEFDYWLLDGMRRTDNPITITMDRDYSLQAFFRPTARPPIERKPAVARATLKLYAMEGGTTAPSPGSYTYDVGTRLIITAIPRADYVFSHWVLDGERRTENPISITLDRDMTLTAYFTSGKARLTIQVGPGGSTQPLPHTYEFNIGERTTVLATPSPGYKFDFWTVDGVRYYENPITLPMDRSYVVTAYFKPIAARYRLVIRAEAGGTVEPSPGTYEYDEGAEVSLVAIPYSGYVFEEWAIDGYYTKDNPVRITMDRSLTAVARFRRAPPTAAGAVRLTLIAAEGGSTTLSPGVHEFPSGTRLRIEAKPYAGYVFDRWVVNGITHRANPIDLYLYGDTTAVAFFRRAGATAPALRGGIIGELLRRLLGG